VDLADVLGEVVFPVEGPVFFWFLPAGRRIVSINSMFEEINGV
jgi:hypothetical protein